MKYEAKTIPEGINTSQENPLKEFFLLLTGATLLILSIFGIALLASDYLIKYIPIETEQRWFSGDNFPGPSAVDDPEADVQTAAIENYLQDLVDKLQDGQHPRYSFDVRLMVDDTPNAFITPGGNIFVTSGLLKTVDSENALAMVLGHEMGHQYHRHPIRSAGRGIIIVLAFLALSGFEGSDITQSFIGNTANMTNLVFSREQEREADSEGVRLIVNRYGHAQGASQFFHQIADLEDSYPDTPAFFSTHPGTDERIRFLENHENETSGNLIPLPEFVTGYADQ